MGNRIESGDLDATAMRYRIEGAIAPMGVVQSRSAALCLSERLLKPGQSHSSPVG
jgi:hypothetical protein